MFVKKHREHRRGLTADWCIAFNGGNVDVLSRIFFASLFRHCNPVYLSRTQFHLIDNGGAQSSVNLAYGPSEYIWYTPIEEWKPSKPPDEYYAESVLSPWDMAEYMVENCGDTNWCIISHFDMVFTGDILAQIVGRISSKVGVIGTHCPIMAINRTAYKSRKVGFAPGTGYDVGIALEQDLRSSGWEHPKLDDSCFTHFGGGASHHNKAEFDNIRNRATAINPDDYWKTDKVDRNRVAKMEQIDQWGQTKTIIHYVFQTEPERIACMPNMTEFNQTQYHQVCHRTNSPDAVTCQACKDTSYYQGKNRRRG